jgi:hypothetical protein
VDIFQASRPAVPVWAVQAHHSPAPTSQQTQTPTETAQETATNATAQEPAEETIHVVLVLLLHAAVLVLEILITARPVPTPLAPAEMQPAAVMYVEIHLMVSERIAERFASRATVREAA